MTTIAGGGAVEPHNRTPAEGQIDVTCPGCRRSYRMPSRASGKSGTCKKCGTRFLIPEATSFAQTPPPAPNQSGLSKQAAQTQQLLQLLGDSIVFRRQRITIAHRLTALVVAGLMLLLPIVYVAFAVGVGWLTWWHATNDWFWMKETYGFATAIAAALYVGLILGGVLWTLSLVRPLFSSLSKPVAASRISRRDEPALFAFAERLADKVGCPRPDIICLDLDVNASAYYESSLFGLGQRTFTLTLGMPLVAGMTLCQLSGVMTHEFGHFGQRGSGLLDRFIKRINLWFAAAADRPDLLDDLIQTLTSDGHYLMKIVGLVLMLLVGLGRFFLRCLMLVGLLASASLMRRMEFDADSYEVGLIGSAEFAASSKRLVALTIAHELTFRHAFTSMHCRILPSDIVAFTAELADRAPKVRKRATKMIENEKMSWLASHPPIRDRIAAAERLNLPGVFTSSIPGSALFDSFEARSAAITAMLYSHRYGRRLTPDAVKPVHEAVDIYLDLDASNRF
jgi:Zn-dependent protease with chaperone function